MTNKTSGLYFAKRVFTGTNWLTDTAVKTEEGKITELVPFDPAVEIPEPIYSIIAPAFIDLQIYGAGGKLFSVYPETSSLHILYEYCKAGGASHFQPTVATNSYEVFYQCIDAVKAYWEEGGKGCIGLHVEGPWLNPQKKGAHQEAYIHSPSVTEVKTLLDYGKDVITMITLAPEVCSREVIDLIRLQGIVISAGHSNASYKEATLAFDEGISAATHLYNAMSPLQHREPGIVGAIFDHPSIMCSIVPDGYHVDFSAIRIAKKIMQERLFVITDAVTETTEGPYPHQLAEDRYESNGILSGSALTMAKSARNLVTHVGIDVEEALRMVSLYPAQVMGKSTAMGKIEKGFNASLVMLDEMLEVEMVVD